MNVLVRTVLGLRRLATPEVGFGLAVFGWLLGIEVLGRKSPSDLHDVLGLFALVLLGFMVLARHRRSPLPWLNALEPAGDRLIAFLKNRSFNMGLDMRGDPPVKRGVPPVIAFVATTLACLAVGLGAISQWLPVGMRDVMITGSYVVYLIGLAVFWLLLAGAILLAAFVPIAVIHDAMVARYRGPGSRSRRPEFLFIALYFGALFVGGANLPLWTAPAATAALTVLYLIGVAPGRRFAVQFLWRPRGSIQVRSLSWARWVTWEFLLIGLVMQTLTLAACGALIRGDELAYRDMLLTTMMGVALAWLGPGLLGLLCFQMVMGRLRDPARPAPPTAHVHDHTGVARSAVLRAFRRRGWRVRFHPKPVEPMDVRVAVVAESLPREKPAHEWPLCVTVGDFERDGLYIRLARRDDVQRRRRFMAGLEGLFKRAASRSHGGCGFWLSPHYWFVTGLMRDSRPEDESPEFDLGEDAILSGSVGPPYHRIFPRAVRHHLFRILRATQVDLIFVEDGVSFKRLRKVLRILFEVYDIHNGRRPAEEIDFRGLPRIRVMIHDYQFDDPLHATGYPEPKYEFLGRARILHVFKDRGGDQERLEAPFDMDRTPAPVSLT